MFELVGYSCSYEPDEYNQNNGEAFKHESEEVVATFDNEKDALEYIKKSKLKKAKILPRQPKNFLKMQPLKTKVGI